MTGGMRSTGTHGMLHSIDMCRFRDRVAARRGLQYPELQEVTSLHRLVANVRSGIAPVLVLACGAHAGANGDEAIPVGGGRDDSNVSVAAASPSSSRESAPPSQGELGSNGPGTPETQRIGECSRLSTTARAVVLQAEQSAPQCEADTDCRSYDKSDLSVCWVDCNDEGWGGPARERAVRAAIQSDEVQRTCQQFTALGCVPLPPSCPPGVPVPDNFVGYQCVAQNCVAIYR